MQPSRLRAASAERPRILCGRWAVLLGACWLAQAQASPYVPPQSTDVLATLPIGVAYSSAQSRRLAQGRLDVALPLAQFYIAQARATGDLRFLGYAEGALAPWHTANAEPAVLVLYATILQSRHAFGPALTELDQALVREPSNAQAWLTRATVLRVLGRYDEAQRSCAQLALAGDDEVTALCVNSVRGLSGQLPLAYEAIRQIPEASLSSAAANWRASELGEMAVRLGDNAAAEHWFKSALQSAPADNYSRAAYADLLLSEHRPADVVTLLRGGESMEPLLLRLALAQKQLHDPHLPQSTALLASAFAVEEQRGEAVHRREQARLLLDVTDNPPAALAAALKNWQVQREPDDSLILLRAAAAARKPEAASEAMQFLRTHGSQDQRLRAFLGVPQ